MSSLDRLPRRTFLGLTAALASACAARGSGPGALASGATLSSARSWEAIRDLFPLTRDYVHLASFLLVSHPKPVAEAIERFRRELDANPVLALEREFASNAQSLRTRQSAGSYMGVAPDEIALTDSTTMGLATLYNGLRLAPGCTGSRSARRIVSRWRREGRADTRADERRVVRRGRPARGLDPEARRSRAAEG